MIFLIILSALLLAGIILNFAIRKTPHGLLTFRAAVIRHRFGDTPVTTPVKFRENMEASKRILNSKPAPVEMVEDITTDANGRGVPMRLYHPSPGKKTRVMVYAHGGGWVGGNLSTHDLVCRHLAIYTHWAILAVDYRLAPEHPFPRAVEDMVEVLEWCKLNASDYDLDQDVIVVGGDSAGGNLAAVISNLSRDRFPDLIKAQVLIYPVMNIASLDTASYRYFAKGYRLSYELMDWFRKCYASPEQWSNPQCSPYLEPDLSNLPPTLVITAAFDPLRDEGEAYGKRLEEAGVITQISRYDGVLHGFFGHNLMGNQGISAVLEVAEFINKLTNH